MAKGLYRIFRTKADMERYDEDMRHFTRVFTLDHVTIALGRMGFREAKFREFDKVLTEVCAEYGKEYADDFKDDREMVYSRAVLDRELKQYTGKLFCTSRCAIQIGGHNGQRHTARGAGHIRRGRTDAYVI